MNITELDIVNDMLATMGITPLNELNEDNPDVAGCRRIISQESSKIQQKQWWFNKERIDLFPDALSKFIYIPADAIRCNPIRKPPRMPVVVRGRRLYDTDKNTYQFDEMIECWVVRNIPFNDLPLSAQVVVSMASVRRFQQSFDADRSKLEQINIDFQMAMADLNAEHIRNTDVNLIRKNSTIRELIGIRGGNRRNNF